ncbi:MAG TPA: cobyrinate a,c-diamide synthase [Clostridia bacterium]|nr:cobyrinate a,c-diamide synthase [Clostridia bacterium]
MKKIVLAGTSSDVGKTTITIGLLKALTMKGLKVNAFKSGPDYIDPMFHRFVTKGQSINLDLYLMGEKGVKYAFHKHSKGDISVVEGVMGLYDGVSSGGKEVSSTALLAKTIEAPVILIIDGSGVSTSAAAEVLGFDQFDEELNIVGVIVNKVHGKKHYDLIKEPIERFTGIKCLGYLNRNDAFALESQHLGLIPSEEVYELSKKIEVLGKSISESVDLDALVALSERDNQKVDNNYYTKSNQKNYRLAIAKDKAFNFYYQDNIDYFKDNGIDLIEFSPLESEDLPSNIDGIYLGGGFPEKFAKKLSANKKLIKGINSYAEQGGMIYGECGGLMYLSKAIVDFDGEKYPMTGVLDLEVKMTSQLQHFGYVEVKNHDITFRGHEFHRSKVINENNQTTYKINKFSNPKKIWNGGYIYKNVLAGYPHVHFYSNFEFANLLINRIKKCKEV